MLVCNLRSASCASQSKLTGQKSIGDYHFFNKQILLAAGA